MIPANRPLRIATVAESLQTRSANIVNVEKASNLFSRKDVKEKIVEKPKVLITGFSAAERQSF